MSNENNSINVSTDQIQDNDMNITLTEEQIKALAIVCEDFGYGCKDFPTFGLKGSEIVSKIRELLAKWLPF
jgi:hypothetical protein